MPITQSLNRQKFDINTILMPHISVDGKGDHVKKHEIETVEEQIFLIKGQIEV